LRRKQILASILSLLFAAAFVFTTHLVSAATSKIVYFDLNFSNFGIEVFSVNPDGTSNTQLTNVNPLQAGLFGIKWSPDGTKIAFSLSNAGGTEVYLYVMNADGTGQTKVSSGIWGGIYGVSWSPDSSKIAYVGSADGGSTFNIFSVNADGSGDAQLTTSDTDACPIWSPTNNKIAFISVRDGNSEIYTMDINGTNQTNISNNSDNDGNYTSPMVNAFCSYEISPDASKIIFSTNRDNPSGPTTELYSMSMTGSNQTRLTTSPDDVMNILPHFSPDGSKLLYGSNATDPGNNGDGVEIYTMTSTGGGQTQLTNDGLGNVKYNSNIALGYDWSPDGTQIVFGSKRGGGNIARIYTMNANGTNITAITAGSGSLQFYPIWQPTSQTPNSGGSSSSSSSSSTSAATLANTGFDTRFVAVIGCVLVITGLVALGRNRRIIARARPR
jgi:Tol biopolymer transport system component